MTTKNADEVIDDFFVAKERAESLHPKSNFIRLLLKRAEVRLFDWDVSCPELAIEDIRRANEAMLDLEIRELAKESSHSGEVAKMLFYGQIDEALELLAV